MKILKRIVSAAIFVLLSAFLFLVSINFHIDRFIQLDQFRRWEIYQESSPDGQYTITLYQKGSPKSFFGGVNAELVLTDANGEKLDDEKFELANDGGSVAAGNIVKITWMDTQAEVRMREFDTIRQYTYYLDFSG